MSIKHGKRSCEPKLRIQVTRTLLDGLGQMTLKLSFTNVSKAFGLLFPIVVAAEIYKMLQTVLQQTDLTLFQDYLAQLLECLPSLSLEFYQYFQNEWLGREEWWVYCYRTGIGINTNIMVDVFHRVFKYNFSEEYTTNESITA